MVSRQTAGVAVRKKADSGTARAGCRRLAACRGAMGAWRPRARLVQRRRPGRGAGRGLHRLPAAAGRTPTSRTGPAAEGVAGADEAGPGRGAEEGEGAEEWRVRRGTAGSRAALPAGVAAAI